MLKNPSRIKELLQGNKMKKLTLMIILLLLIKTIYADGIVPDLKTYLEQYPKHITPDGWVTIPDTLLIHNEYKFSSEAKYIVKLSKHAEIYVHSFDTNSVKIEATSYYIYQINYMNKTQGKCINPEYTIYKVEYIKQKTRESIILASTMRLEKNLLKKINTVNITLEKKLSDMTMVLVHNTQRIESLEKKNNKSYCKNCTIL